MLSAPEKHNLCLVSPDYRLAPQTRIPGILADAKAALDFSLLKSSRRHSAACRLLSCSSQRELRGRMAISPCRYRNRIRSLWAERSTARARHRGVVSNHRPPSTRSGRRSRDQYHIWIALLIERKSRHSLILRRPKRVRLPWTGCARCVTII